MAMVLVFRQLAEVPPFLTDRSLPLQILYKIGQENLLATRHPDDALLDLPTEEYAPPLAALRCHKASPLVNVITRRVTIIVFYKWLHVNRSSCSSSANLTNPSTRQLHASD